MNDVRKTARRVVIVGIIAAGILLPGCVLMPQIIIVRFDDLRSDLIALEASLEDGAWTREGAPTMAWRSRR